MSWEVRWKSWWNFIQNFHNAKVAFEAQWEGNVCGAAGHGRESAGPEVR